ncbi:MAG: 3-carboxy-cis,cis-muconate cycloisomerase [Acidobacteriota bacterium]|nr:3-carboxy-cis,cis-muconate cycloisomerase [Acidobacteriota bacterium]
MATDSISPLFSTPEMDRVFSVAHQLRQMTRFEWALSAALESAGLAHAGAGAAIEPFLDAAFVDVPSLFLEARQAGNLAIPFVRQLTAAVRERHEEAARSVHFGATSQDVLDTALVLQMREAIALILADIAELDKSLTRQVRAHAGTILAGRTWLQDGPPVTLGLKIAGWLAALRRHRQRLEAVATRALVLQFGGAVGTLAALGSDGAAVSAAVAQKLELQEAELPWHTHRDNLVEVAAALGMLAGTLGKVARDVSLLMQTEVAEVLEPGAEGRGGSSTMPHKRNPVASAVILAAAARIPGLVSTLLAAMTQEHERGVGNWQAEWEVYPEIFRLTAAALDRTLEIARGMEVFPGQMAAHLDQTRGLALSEAVSAALARHMGKEHAHELIHRATQLALAEHRHLREILLAMPEIREHLSEEEIGQLLDPRNYLGSAQRFIDRVLGETDAVR